MTTLSGGVPAAADQQELDVKNASFWSELCGTTFARQLGIEDGSEESLRRFDAAYLNFYPYLSNYIPPKLSGQRVLEIGLGFGTLGHLLAARGADYYGLDISPAPVEMMRERLGMVGLLDGHQRVQVGSALAIPHPDGAFDAVFSIGCLHHTGDLGAAVAEVRRVVKPGGTATVMVYNRDSLRQRLARLQARGGEQLRAAYDANLLGEAAPATEYVSSAEARSMFSGFDDVRIQAENFDEYTFLRGLVRFRRSWFLGAPARALGLDLYIVATG